MFAATHTQTFSQNTQVRKKPSFGMRTTAYEYGLDAEALAVKYLEDSGYNIIFRRYKTRFGEIDIVAQIAETIVFVEVKGRKNGSFEYSMSRQIKRNSTAAAYFMGMHPFYQGLGIRFDLIEMNGLKLSRHLENAWEYREPVAFY